MYTKNYIKKKWPKHQNKGAPRRHLHAFV